MPQPKRGLGKGLGALIPTAPASPPPLFKLGELTSRRGVTPDWLRTRARKVTAAHCDGVTW